MTQSTQHTTIVAVIDPPAFEAVARSAAQGHPLEVVHEPTPAQKAANVSAPQRRLVEFLPGREEHGRLIFAGKLRHLRLPVTLTYGAVPPHGSRQVTIEVPTQATPA